MLLDEMGARIRDLRNRLGFTQTDLAAALQVSPQAVSKWERGENAPDITLLPLLSEVLGASIDTLLGATWKDNKTVEATVVFADMEGFSPLARDLSAAELAIVLNTFFFSLTEHLVARGAVPIKYVGDELLCVFIGEEHRIRAFRGAFEARAASPRPLRITLTSGAIWMGAIGHPEHSRPDVLGESVNHAALLQGWAKSHAKGGVAASDGAVDPVREKLRLGNSEEIKTWGSSSPVRAWEILGLA